jgi:hypothetical protein
MTSDGWQGAWQPLVDMTGQEFGRGPERPGADAVSAEPIRRFLEVLEFDCPLHHD